MKINNFIKVGIVLVSLSILVYIVKQNDKEAKDMDIVRNPIERYDFMLYVDSVCNEIKLIHNNYNEAKQKYNLLYEEIDVYSKIKKNDKSVFFEDSLTQKAFDMAINSYWPAFVTKANSVFQSSNWSDRNMIKNDVSELDKRGKTIALNLAQIDSLKNYSSYIVGYTKFNNLLKELEKCKNAETYKKRSSLNNYKKYPYSNLSDFQERANNAQTNAKKYWLKHLQEEGKNIEDKCKNWLSSGVNETIIRDEYIPMKNTWIESVESYERTVGDNNTFVNQKERIKNLFEDLVNAVNSISTTE